MAVTLARWSRCPELLWWDWIPSYYLESGVSRLRNRTAIESAHLQNRPGKLTMRLLADSNCLFQHRDSLTGVIVAPAAVVTTGAQATFLKSCVLNRMGRVIATELFVKLFLPMHGAESALHLRLGRETFPSLAGDLEKMGCLDRMIGLSYDGQVEGCGVGLKNIP